MPFIDMSVVTSDRRGSGGVQVSHPERAQEKKEKVMLHRWKQISEGAE